MRLAIGRPTERLCRCTVTLRIGKSLQHGVVIRGFALLVLGFSGLRARPLPYELIAPEPSRTPEALIIALRGAAVSSKFYCGWFVKGRYEKLARERGYIVACPAGVGIKPMYEEFEPEILAIREELLKRYPGVRKVFLTGHSLGGRGALLLGLRHPDKFAAIAPIAPALRIRKDTVGTVDSIAPQILAYPRRIFLGYAIRDIVAPLMPDDLGKLILAGAGRLEPHLYNADHVTIGAASAEDLFDFFDRERGFVKLNARDGTRKIDGARQSRWLRRETEPAYSGPDSAPDSAAAR